MKHNLNGKNNEIQFLYNDEVSSARFLFIINFMPFLKRIICQRIMNLTIRKYKKLMTLKKTVNGRKYGFTIIERK